MSWTTIFKRNSKLTRKYVVLTELQKDSLAIDKHHSQMSDKQLAEKYGVSLTTVRRIYNERRI